MIIQLVSTASISQMAYLWEREGFYSHFPTRVKWALQLLQGEAGVRMWGKVGWGSYSQTVEKELPIPRPLISSH